MASPKEYDDVPMLPVSDTASSSRTSPFTSKPRSVSLANTSSTIDVFENSTVVLGYTDPPATSNSTSHNALDDDAKGWARRFATCVDKCLPKIKDHHTYSMIWTKFFVFSCLCSIFVDPLFFYPIEIYKKDMCIRFDWWVAKAIVAARTATDVLFCVNILIQCRLPYLAHESTTVVGVGQLVDDPIKIARRYRRGKLWVDLFIVLPLPQILLLGIIPYQLGTSWANNTKNFLTAAVLIQNFPKLYRFFPLIAGETPKGFIFESALVKFFINLLTFMLAGHVVGSCWYLFGLQRVNQCLRVACAKSIDECKQLIDCGREASNEVLETWRGNMSAIACFEEGGFHYGIYWKAVNLTTNTTVWYTRYSYSLFWGFQQISTLAGNLVPSYYFGEVIFTMVIIGVGLLLFALLIGNIQNFLQSLGRRDMEMTLRRRDVEQWMSHRQFPKRIRKRVRDAERLKWADTRGVNEEVLFKNMPDDLQRDIRRHRFAFLKKVRIFSKMDEEVLDAIREKLKQRIYLEGCMVLRRGDLIKNMVFIMSGKMVSTGEDGSRTTLLEGDVCGEELVTWYQKRSSVNPDGTRIRMPSEGLDSNRDVCCVKNVEAFSLSVEDLEGVVTLFPDCLEIPKES